MIAELSAVGDEPESAPALVKVWRYVGNGFWVPGVPARDLTIDDIASLLTDAWHVAFALGLYEEVTDAGA